MHIIDHTQYLNFIVNVITIPFEVEKYILEGGVQEEFIEEFELYHIEKLFYFRIIQHVMSVDFFI